MAFCEFCSILEQACVMIGRQSLHHHWIANPGSPPGQCRRLHLLEGVPWSTLRARGLSWNHHPLCTGCTRHTPKVAGSVFQTCVNDYPYQRALASYDRGSPYSDSTQKCTIGHGILPPSPTIIETVCSDSWQKRTMGQGYTPPSPTIIGTVPQARSKGCSARPKTPHGNL